jgi:hypothetical protein
LFLVIIYIKRKIWYTTLFGAKCFTYSGVLLTPLCLFLSVSQSLLLLLSPFLSCVATASSLFSYIVFAKSHQCLSLYLPGVTVTIPLPPQKLFLLKYNFFYIVETLRRVAALIFFLKHFVAFSCHLYVEHHQFHSEVLI